MGETKRPNERSDAATVPACPNALGSKAPAGASREFSALTLDAAEALALKDPHSFDFLLRIAMTLVVSEEGDAS